MVQIENNDLRKVFPGQSFIYLFIYYLVYK